MRFGSLRVPSKEGSSTLAIYIYIIYTLNLELGIAVLGREREQGLL